VSAMVCDERVVQVKRTRQVAGGEAATYRRRGEGREFTILQVGGIGVEEGVAIGRGEARWQAR